jgi:enoyl-CoA hydratase/3-hydroxyacyl-CoA dehydrogenase
MALGGGFELALRCHALVAMRDAWMQFPEITLGILPGIGAMVVPYRRWPAAGAVFHGMLRRAEKLTATRAHELGIVTALADDQHTLLSQAIAEVHRLAGRAPALGDAVVALAPLEAVAPVAANGMALSPVVIGLMEDAIREAARAPTIKAALEVGYRAFGQSACTAAAREGIAAFGERRRPDFTRTG